MKNYEIKKLYDFYIDEVGLFSDKMHNIIKKDFVNNEYARSSNQDIEAMWSLYKNEMKVF